VVKADSPQLLFSYKVDGATYDSSKPFDGAKIPTFLIYVSNNQKN
jgi:hypothetical protein